MAIPNPDSARQITKIGGGVGSFLSTMIKDETKRPATLNKWTISFASPPILLGNNVGGQSAAPDKTQLEGRDVADLLDYYAKNVSLPSRQITTSQFSPPGASVRYATNQAFSQMQMEFIVPASQYTRAIFETWVNRISRDSNQMVDFYTQYVSPRVRVYKWESQAGKNVLTGCWEMSNVFPYNIGSIQLSNEQNQLMTLTMGFYYERYRFFNGSQFSDPGTGRQITVPGSVGDTVDDATERNSTLNTQNTYTGETHTVAGVTYRNDTGQPIAYDGSYTGPRT
jgi:hypothetical protein